MNAAPQTLGFSTMKLIARDYEPTIVVGAGEFRCPTPSRFEYTLTGTPADPVYAFAQIRRQQAHPYDGQMRFRLILEDEDGRSYNAGWTIPKVRQGTTGEGPWVFEGECQGLTTDDQTVEASDCGASEVEFIIPRRHRAFLFLSQFVSTPLPDGGTEPVHRLTVLDMTVTFRFDAERGVLSIAAPGGGALSLPYAENWLGEPLRILFGQLAFPRVVARSFPEGGAMISQRASPSWSTVSDWAALWDREDLFDQAGFWSLYDALLTYIASARDEAGHPNFEANTITRLYEEVIQAARGSRWVWALTFASSIEGLVRILTPRKVKRPDADAEGIKALVAHIGEWGGVDPENASAEAQRARKAKDTRLRGVAVGAIHRTAETTAKYILDQLIAKTVVTQDQVQAWTDVRNAVMHGSLVSPYSSPEDDALLLNLADLMHALTREIVRSDRAPSISSGDQAPSSSTPPHGA